MRKVRPRKNSYGFSEFSIRHRAAGGGTAQNPIFFSRFTLSYVKRARAPYTYIKSVCICVPEYVRAGVCVRICSRVHAGLGQGVGFCDSVRVPSRYVCGDFCICVYVCLSDITGIRKKSIISYVRLVRSFFLYIG